MSKIIGIIVCDEDKKLGGEDGVGSRTIDLFKKCENENWEYFKAVSGYLPDISKLENYAGFILTGSYWSANDQAKWISNLTDFIQEVFRYQQVSNNAPKLFGICFGHQLIAKAFGARVIKNEYGKFIICRADVEVFDNLRNKEFYQRVFYDEKYIRLIQCHQEEVTDLPDNAVLLGTSEHCKNEIVSYGDKILTMQGHMDILEEDLTGRFLLSLKESGKVDEFDEAFLFNSLKGKPTDCLKIIEMIRQFLGL